MDETIIANLVKKVLKESIGEEGEMIKLNTDEQEHMKEYAAELQDEIIDTIVKKTKTFWTSPKVVRETVARVGIDETPRRIERLALYSLNNFGLKMITYKRGDIKYTGLPSNTQGVKKGGIEDYSRRSKALMDKLQWKAIKNGEKNTYKSSAWIEYHSLTRGEHSLPQNVLMRRLLFAENVSEEREKCYTHPFVSILKEEDDEIRKNGYSHKGDGAKERYHFEIVEGKTWDEEWADKVKKWEKMKNGN